MESTIEVFRETGSGVSYQISFREESDWGTESQGTANHGHAELGDRKDRASEILKTATQWIRSDLQDILDEAWESTASG